MSFRSSIISTYKALEVKGEHSEKHGLFTWFDSVEQDLSERWNARLQILRVERHIDSRKRNGCNASIKVDPTRRNVSK